MANSGNIGNNDAKTAELPKAVDDAIAVAVFKAVRRAINALRREVEAKRPRMVTEKHYDMTPGAFSESVRLHGALVRENERGEKLLADLRAIRAELATKHNLIQ